MVPVKWTEDKSENTFENILFSAKILHSAKINIVFVVAQSWHMPHILL
ncbi:MAG: ElyC/SanA/YdcF family protein, partial [Stellaceae bacterium]